MTHLSFFGNMFSFFFFPSVKNFCINIESYSLLEIFTRWYIFLTVSRHSQLTNMSHVGPAYGSLAANQAKVK